MEKNRRGERQVREDPARNLKIAGRVFAGESIKQVAEDLDLSVSRVGVIVAKVRERDGREAMVRRFFRDLNVSGFQHPNTSSVFSLALAQVRSFREEKRGTSS